MSGDFIKRKGTAFVHNVANLSSEEQKRRVAMVMVYFTMEKVFLGIGILLVVLYTVLILVYFRNAKTEKERADMKFNHEVLWGYAGTDGTLHFMAKLIFGFVVLMFTGRFIYYAYKTNIDLFQDVDSEDVSKQNG